MLQIVNLAKSFGEQEILHNINLHIKEGEFLALVGESGSGKSTLLRIIAGLEEQSSGEIRKKGIDISKHTPKDRNFAMVFQSYALYPHFSVEQNLAAPLIARTKKSYALPFAKIWSKKARVHFESIESKVKQVAHKLKIAHLLDKKPRELSGGQCQRVALGRAIIREPDIFLMDEPLSNLDAKLRIHTRGEISQIHRELNKTFIYVTHDQTEAMTMSDRIAFLVDGHLLQVDTPDRMYNDPQHLKVAQFIGTPTINTTPITLRANSIMPTQSSDYTLAIRAENLTLDSTSPIQATIHNIENMGNEYLIYTQLHSNNAEFVLSLKPSIGATLSLGQDIGIGFDFAKAFLFDKQGRRIAMPQDIGNMAIGNVAAEDIAV